MASIAVVSAFQIGAIDTTVDAAVEVFCALPPHLGDYPPTLSTDPRMLHRANPPTTCGAHVVSPALRAHVYRGALRVEALDLASQKPKPRSWIARRTPPEVMELLLAITTWRGGRC